MRLVKDGHIDHDSGLINPLRKGLASRSPAQMQDETHLARKSFLQCNVLHNDTQYTNTNKHNTHTKYKHKDKIQNAGWDSLGVQDFMQCNKMHSYKQKYTIMQWKYY